MQPWPQPPILPQAKVTLASAVDQNAGRLDMEAGTSRQRQLYTESRLVANIAWSFTQREMDIFAAFLKFKLTDGTDDFIFPMNFGGGSQNHVVRFIEGSFTQAFDALGFWVVTGQLETVFSVGYCTPNLTGFLTNPKGAVHLAAYFGFPVCSPFAATKWRLHTDECGYNIEYFLGDVNSDGSLNPGTNVIVSPGVTGTGWNSGDLSFWSAYEYPEGMYLQVKCGNLWSNLPCIAGGNGSPP